MIRIHSAKRHGRRRLQHIASYAATVTPQPRMQCERLSEMKRAAQRADADTERFCRLLMGCPRPD